jgi:coenzyme F420-0:L-glutamate ligase / coenzyme F420-1:gamma-L-glutamate ligase
VTDVRKHVPVARSDRLEEVIRGRRSVRAFRSDPVPRAVIERALEAAGWAPSPHGRQPWRFVVLESEERRRMLADAMAADWREQLELDGQPSEIVETRLEKGRARLLDAPVVVLVCLYLEDLDDYPDVERQAAEQTMAIQSLGSAMQNFLLTIYAEGFDAGWMCAPLFCPDIVRDTLDLGATLHPHAMAPVGVAAKDPVRPPRRLLDELVVSWE